MRTIRATRRLSQGKQPLHAHLHRRRVYGTSASPGGALHTPEGDLATIGLLNKMPHEESPSRQWTGWRTNMLPRSSMRLPLDSCSDAAADAIEASAHRSHPRAFDLVVSGGGLAAFYGGAVSSVLATLARRGVLEVGLLHGVSSGALVCATFLGCEAGFTKGSGSQGCVACAGQLGTTLGVFFGLLFIIGSGGLWLRWRVNHAIAGTMPPLAPYMYALVQRA